MGGVRIGSLLLAGVLTASPSPQPPAPPQPLKTIVRERVSPFCAQLRQTIGGSVAGILHNDEWVQRAKVILAQMSRDWIQSGGPRVAMDRVRLESVIGGLVRNLTIVDSLLATTSATDPRLASMRAQLSSAADQQREVLNILGIVLDSTEVNTQLEDFYRHNPRASRSAIANVKQRYDRDTAVYRDPVLAQVTGLYGDSPYANPLLYLIANDLQTRDLESQAAKSIVTDAKVCGSDVPLVPPNLPYSVPSPSPEPR